MKKKSLNYIKTSHLHQLLFKTLRLKMVILMFVSIDLVAKWLKDRACEPQVTSSNPPKILFIFKKNHFLKSKTAYFFVYANNTILMHHAIYHN